MDDLLLEANLEVSPALVILEKKPVGFWIQKISSVERNFVIHSSFNKLMILK